MHKADSSFSTFLLPPSPPSPLLPFTYLLLATSPTTSASFYIRYLKALPLSVLSALLSRLSTRTLVVSLLYVLLPLFIVPFNPASLRPALLRHILLIYPLCFSEELECLLYARISLLNLVLQVTILLLSPFSSRYFSCHYSTLLLFLVNAPLCLLPRARTSGSPFIFLHTLGFHASVCFYIFRFPLLFIFSLFLYIYICFHTSAPFLLPLMPSFFLARDV